METNCDPMYGWLLMIGLVGMIFLIPMVLVYADYLKKEKIIWVRTDLTELAPFWYRMISNYRIWEVTVRIPKYGSRINNWLRKRELRKYETLMGSSWSSKIMWVSIPMGWKIRKRKREKEAMINATHRLIVDSKRMELHNN